MDNDFFVLEYQQSSGQFHYNSIRDGRPHDKLSTNGWEPVAVTTFWKAGLFCDVTGIRIYKLTKAGQNPLTLDEVKAEWRYFNYVFNYVLRDALNGFDHFGTYLKALEDYDDQRAIAELGDPHQSGYREAENISGDILDYDPTNGYESNFYK